MIVVCTCLTWSFITNAGAIFILDCSTCIWYLKVFCLYLANTMWMWLVALIIWFDWRSAAIAVLHYLAVGASPMHQQPLHAVISMVSPPLTQLSLAITRIIENLKSLLKTGQIAHRYTFNVFKLFWMWNDNWSFVIFCLVFLSCW